MKSKKKYRKIQEPAKPATHKCLRGKGLDKWIESIFGDKKKK